MFGTANQMRRRVRDKLSISHSAEKVTGQVEYARNAVKVGIADSGE